MFKEQEYGKWNFYLTQETPQIGLDNWTWNK
jgi:hypothetical protein